jgi:NADH dehydrogenase [ubiquinone] 1 alpha subcomplex assembly factor 7
MYTLEGWQERGVMRAGDAYEWATRAADTPPQVPPYLPAPIPGNMLETCPDMEVVLAEIAQRLKQYAGSALFIDYGYARVDYGDTFQAVSGHEFADPLENPGEQDLTAHVNFAAIENFGRAAELQVAGPSGQGEFLMRLGMQIRADKLLEHTDNPADKLEVIEAAYRLTSPDEMGTLFKVICLSSKDLPPPEGF